MEKWESFEDAKKRIEKAVARKTVKPLTKKEVEKQIRSGKLTEEQERNYFEKTNPLSEEEVKEWIRRFREIPNTLGWKWIMKTDSEFGNKQ